MAHFVRDKRNVEIQIPYDLAAVALRLHRLVFVRIRRQQIFGIVVHTRVLSEWKIIT